MNKKKIIDGLRLGLGSQGIWTPELEEIILEEIKKKELDEIINLMIKKGYGKNFMNGDLVVAMVADILDILKNKL
ncbi:MAG: hypothetical protein ACOVK2_04905 [Candidatus Fonsibacter sp.]